MKLYVEDCENTLFEHANLRQNTTGQPFDLWLDEAGCDRNVQHNEPRVKVRENGIELDIIIHNNGKLEIVNDERDIRKFKHSKEAVEFIDAYKDVLRMHWNHEIDTGDVAVVMRSFKRIKEKDAIAILDLLDKVIKGEI